MPSVKYEMAIASTSYTNCNGRYCNFNNIKNSCFGLLRQLTLMKKFHLRHQLSSPTQNTTALKHNGYRCIQWSLKKYDTPLNITRVC